MTKTINYDGKIDQDLVSHLNEKNTLIILRHGKKPYKVVIGVPHQSAIGQEYICEESEKRPSDENAASYAIAAFKTLRDKATPCKLVIMAHSTKKDPNKENNSPYWNEIFLDDAKILLECHGAGSNRQNELELSAGKNELSDTIKFGKLLHSALDKKYDLAIQKKAGKNNALILGKDGAEQEGILQMPAKQTKSLMEAQKQNIHALHLEAKPRFRIPEEGKNVTDDGIILGNALAQAIIGYNVLLKTSE